METPSPAALIISGAFPLCPIDNQLGVMEDAAGGGSGNKVKSTLDFFFTGSSWRPAGLHRFLVRPGGKTLDLPGSGWDPRSLNPHAMECCG